METRFAVHLATLDSILQQPNRISAGIDRLQQEIPNNYVTQRYFFERLEEPDWLLPLLERGFFSNPPAPEVSDDGRFVQYPAWPQLTYLLRVVRSGGHNDEVLSVLEKIPPTENPRVEETCVEIALALPPNLAASALPRFLALLQNPLLQSVRGYYGENLGKLIAHLARDDQIDAALALTEALLHPYDREAHDVTVEGLGNVTLGEPRTHLDSYDYELVCRESLPALVDAAGLDALELLCKLLDRAIVAAETPNELTPPVDLLDIWFPEIESEDEVRYSVAGVRGVLVGTVRDSADRLVRADPQQLTSVIELLRSHPWEIYERLELHLVRTHFERAPEIATSRLADLSFIQRDNLLREYKLLLRDHFGRLPHDAQQLLIATIEAGPDTSTTEDIDSGQRASEDDDTELARTVRLWKWERLLPIRAYLEGSARRDYESLSAEFEASEQPHDLEFRRSRTRAEWIAPPLTTDQLIGMSVAEMVSYLNSWEPDGSILAPDHESLAHVVAGAVEKDPSRFAASALEFADLRAIHLWGYFHGLWKAIQAGAGLPWEPVIELCLNANERFDARVDKSAEADPWRSVRRELAELLTIGLGRHKDEIPLGLRGKVWVVLESLMQDPSPSREDDARFSDTPSGPSELALNSVRGATMEAIVEYALWVRRALRSSREGLQGWEEMPEVEGILERCLDPLHEPSPAVRSVFGRLLPWMVVMDKDWVQRSLPLILPKANHLSSLRMAAWNSYLMTSQLHDGTFQMLREEYEEAIGRLVSGEIDASSRSDRPEFKLAEHLMLACWLGYVSTDPLDPLILQFFQHAPASVREHAVAAIGRRLSSSGSVEESIEARLRALWEWRIGNIENMDHTHEYQAELGQFSTWYASGALDEAWALNQLTLSLSLGGKCPYVHQVIERLVAVVDKYPRSVSKCVDLIVSGPNRTELAVSYRLSTWKSILSTLVASDDDIVRQSGVVSINRLIAGGHTVFRELLPS